MLFVPPARHLLRAKDLADARYFEPLDVDDLAARRRPLARPLQPRVPARLRRVAARLPAHPPPRARRGAAAHHRPLGRRHLLLRRAAERRLVHDQLHAHLRHVADRVPRGVPAGRRPRAGPELRPPRLRAPATQHVSRRQQPDAAPSLAGDLTSTRGGHDDQDRQRAAVGPRPGRGARLLHPEARHGGPRRRHPRRAGQLPLAHRRPARAARRLDRADGDPGPAGDGRGDRRAGAER